MTNDQIQAIADTAAERAIRKFADHLPCGLSPESAKELPHLWGMIKDIGDGDHAKGVEALRSLLKMHRKVEKIGGILLYLLVAAVFGILWKGGESWWAHFFSK